MDQKILLIFTQCCPVDGRKSCPINHGKTTPETFLQASAQMTREYYSMSCFCLQIVEEACYNLSSLSCDGGVFLLVITKIQSSSLYALQTYCCSCVASVLKLGTIGRE